MRRVILSMSMSIDGFVGSDRQHPGALPEDDELVQWRLDWMSGAAGAHLMGRKSYQEMATFWPTSEHPYAAPMNDIPKVVSPRPSVTAKPPGPQPASRADPSQPRSLRSRRNLGPT